MPPSTRNTCKQTRLTKTTVLFFLTIAVFILAMAGPDLLRGTCLAWADDAQDSPVSTGIVITSQDSTAHQYQAHKLLSASLENGVVTNPSLQGCIPTSAYTMAGASKDDIATAEALAEWLVDAAANDSDGTFTVALAKAVLQTESDGGLEPAATFSSGQTTALEAGYWLVTSNDTQPMIVPINQGEVLHAQEKSTVPVPTKVVSRNNASQTDSWQKSSSASVGDTVSYRLESTLPSNLAAFSSYRLWLCDELGDGLEYDGGSVSPRIVHSDGTSETVDLTVNIDGHKMRVGSDDILTVYPALESTDTVVVEYTCTVSASASLGLSNGNSNTFVVEYQASPTADAVHTGVGTSVASTAEICCFQINLRQVREDGSVITGGSYILRNENGDYRTASYGWSNVQADAQIVSSDQEGLASFTGLGTGVYALIETTPPQGYNLITEPIMVDFSVTNASNANNALQTQSAGESQVAGVGTLAATTHDTRTLTAQASGSGARVINVDAANGVITVQVKSTESDPDPNGDDPEPDPNGDDPDPSNNGDKPDPSKKKPTTPVPATGDQLYLVGVGVLVASIGFIVLGVLIRRLRQGQRDDGSHAQ